MNGFDNNTLENMLHDALQEKAEEIPPPAEPLERTPWNGRKRLWVALSIVASVVLVGSTAGATIVARHKNSPKSSAHSVAPSSSTPTSAKPGATPSVAESWSTIPASDGVGGNFGVWTGNEFIVGESACCDDIGKNVQAAWNPTTQKWRTIAAMPGGQHDDPVSFWDGTEMISIGGIVSANGRLSDGKDSSDTFAYNPKTNAWKPLKSAPFAVTKTGSVAVWTGKKVFVGRERFDNGVQDPNQVQFESFTPSTNTWEEIPMTKGSVGLQALSLYGSSTAWTGKEIIIWGSGQQDAPSFTGAAYNPETNEWRSLPGAPIGGRTGFVSAWTGTEFVVWGGTNASGDDTFADGAAYNPTTNTWRELSASPLLGRAYPMSTWTGRELIVIGGLNKSGDNFSSGAAYDPATDSWRKLPVAPSIHRDLPGPPAQSPASARNSALTAWTGKQMLMVSGFITDFQGDVNDGVAYAPHSS